MSKAQFFIPWLVVGATEEVESQLQALGKKELPRLIADRYASRSPQLIWSWWGKEETLSIEMVRDIIGQLSLSVGESELQVHVLLNLDQASLPAQQALLKTLEEPPSRTQLIITTRHESSLLPTIISRCRVIRLAKTEPQAINSDHQELWKKIISGNYTHAEAIELVEPLGDREVALGVVTSLTRLTHQALLANPRPDLVKFAQLLVMTQTDLDKNVNVKLALEHCFFEWLKSKKN
jgi:hypothetical protein